MIINAQLVSIIISSFLISTLIKNEFYFILLICLTSNNIDTSIFFFEASFAPKSPPPSNLIYYFFFYFFRIFLLPWNEDCCISVADVILMAPIYFDRTRFCQFFCSDVYLYLCESKK